jgi:pimeloyl-ACP methyl ester carboxylesterase
VTAPTLLIYGDHDARAPLTVANGLHAAITDSTLFVLSGVGHVCNVEAPHELNEAVRSFLSQHG